MKRDNLIKSKGKPAFNIPQRIHAIFPEADLW